MADNASEARETLRALYMARYKLGLRVGELTKQLQSARHDIATLDAKIDSVTRRFIFGERALQEP